ncbi:RNase H domain-containing protein [Trichonephila clavipes]|nr:RNase H domain-containing protein [Trichonephila clavipes]
MRKAIWAVWGHSCSTDDEPMPWFCPTNPNTWCKYNAAINNNLQNYKHKPSVAKAVRDVIKPVFADLSHPALLKKCLGGKTQNPNERLNSLIWKFCPKTIGSSFQIAEIAANLATSVFNDGNQILISILEKFGLKINRNVCVSLAERDNRRIFTSRQRRLESSFEARRAKKIKRVKKLSCFRNRKVYLTILAHFSVLSITRLDHPVPSTSELTYLELFSSQKAQNKEKWLKPPFHKWYKGKIPGLSLSLPCDRQFNTCLSRLASGHFKSLSFSEGNKRYPICPKCQLEQASPQHVLDCLGLDWEDILHNPLLVSDFIRVNGFIYLCGLTSSEQTGD